MSKAMERGMAQTGDSWTLASGMWQADAKQNFMLKGSEEEQAIVKQLYHLPMDGEKIFPPEFVYNPATGRKLEKKLYSSMRDAWIAPYGQSVSGENGSEWDVRAGFGLHYSDCLRRLKNKQKCDDDEPDKKIFLDLHGNMEFLSICVGTEVPQLVGLNKSNGELFMFVEAMNEWKSLKAKTSLLERCSDELHAFWGIESFYNKEQKQHVLFLPTELGLAELRISGRELAYTVIYYGQGRCIGSPVSWNKNIYFPVEHGGSVKIWEKGSNKSVFSISEKENFFSRVVFDGRNLIWLGDAGKCHLTLNAVKELQPKYEPWPDGYKPDFRYGPPFLNNEGNTYQLFFYGDGYVYRSVNTAIPVDKPIRSPRFTTGSTVYEFNEKLSSRKNRKNIWDIFNQGDSGGGLSVPLMEDKESGKELVLGICIAGGEKGKDSILNETSKQLTRFFIDTANGMHYFFRDQFSEPMIKSRFFYHGNYLYFYHPESPNLLGWEVE